MYFPEKFISIMIMASLVFIGVAALILIILLIRDIRSKKLW